MDSVTVQREGTTVDLLLWRRHGAAGKALLEQTLNLNLNPGVAALGPVLPIGTVVMLPDLPAKSAMSTRRVVSLFGAS